MFRKLYPKSTCINRLTYPLPPLLLRDWGRTASHSAIPIEDVFTTAVIEEDAGNAAAESTSGEENPFGTSEPKTSTDTRPVAAAQPPSRPVPSGKQGDLTWDGATPYLLLRYFDKKAVPGHQYRYRVQLVLRDVNLGVEKRYLDKSVVERQEAKKTKYPITFTPWSEPSAVVSAPMPARTYLVAAEPGKGYKEPRLELLIKSLDSEYAAEVAVTESFSRGSVVNIKEKAAVVTAQKYEPQDEPDFFFRTGVTILDFSGGSKLSSKNRDLIAPSRAVLMDPSGKLFLQTELDDSDTVAEYQQILAGDP